MSKSHEVPYLQILEILINDNPNSPINNKNRLKKQYENYLNNLLPICIYTTYLITIVDDGKEKGLPLKKHNLLCGAVG
jgi:hypothetical protein